jgi:NAD(P)-dependent dehydrogenase (short-subunit alcohol dehydrogenase family)
MFTKSIDEVSKSKRGAMLEGIKRYLNSKLGVLYIAMELNTRLQEAGTKNIIVNAVHPGECSDFSL